MSEFDRFSALSFDCYGTLIDWETGIVTALRRWAENHGVRATDAGLLEAFGRFETVVESEHPTTLYPDILGMTLDRIAEHYGAETTEEERTAFGGSVGAWPAFADSADSLARLKERFKLIVLSNVDRASFAVSNERLGVEFDVIITAQDVGAYKPSPRNFAALFDALGPIGMTKVELVHVAESLYHDHEPARAVGLASVWIHRRHSQGGSGATAPPTHAVAPKWRYPSMAAFADAAT
jgi:2-haloacid dehalogenase